MDSGGPNPSVVGVVAAGAFLFGMGFQSLWNWVAHGSPALTGDDVGGTGTICVIVGVAALYAGRGKR